MFKIRSALILMTLILLVLLIPACGGDDDNGEEPASTPTSTLSDKPVKIGVLTAWSGAAAMSGTFYIDPIIKVVEKQVEGMGGILGGRPVEFVRYDTKGTTANAAAGARKLILENKVSVMTIGGVAGSEAAAIAEVAEEEKVLFASVIPLNDVAGREYMVVCSISMQSVVDDATDLVLEVLEPKPQTAAVMAYDEPETRSWVAEWKQNVEAAGIEIVYEEYISHGFSDFSTYLTNIKYEDPEVILLDLDNAQMMTIAKQIMDLGGWGDIRVISFGNALSAAQLTGSEGVIVISPWHLSKVDPESIRFKNDYETANGKSPSEMHVYIYNNMWAAIHAIELADTDDPVAIAQAARSGNLVFDTPMGTAHFGTDGLSDLRNMYVQILKGGETVPYP